MVILEVKDLVSGYGKMQVLHKVSFEVRKGHLVSLLGPNGVGKSTILRTISGLIPTKEGSIVFCGKNIAAYTPDQIVEEGLIHVPEGRKLFTDMSVRENLELGAYPNRARRDMNRNLEWVFELFPILKEREKQLVGSMSGGQQQMVAIARGLMSKPELLILDEPSIGLSPLLTKQVFEIIKTINQQQVTVLLVEQNVEQALSISDMAYVVEHGRVVLSGSGQELLQNEQLREAYLGKKSNGS
jgi:branched-chain amino acid transport system ATP-binding protein